MVFQEQDKEGTGHITFEEFSTGLRLGAVFLGDIERRTLWAFLDRDGQGEIAYGVFDDYMQQMQVYCVFAADAGRLRT